MANCHQHPTDDHGTALAKQAVGDKAAEHGHEIRQTGIEAEDLRSERLRVEAAEQEFEGCFDRAEAEHGLDPTGLEQILHHIENDQRGIAEIREALPAFGREQDGEPGRVAEKVARADPGCRDVAPRLRGHGRAITHRGGIHVLERGVAARRQDRAQSSPLSLPLPYGSSA